MCRTKTIARDAAGNGLGRATTDRLIRPTRVARRGRTDGLDPYAGSMRSWRPWLIGGTFAVVAVVLSLSDVVPVVLRGVLDAAIVFWRRFELAFGIDLDIDQNAIPWSSDEIAHLVLWGGGMILVGLTLRHRQRSDRVAVGLFGASVLLEVLQAFVTASRSLTLSDAAANGLGIMLGLTVVVVADLVMPSARSSAEAHA